MESPGVAFPPRGGTVLSVGPARETTPRYLGIQSRKNGDSSRVDIIMRALRASSARSDEKRKNCHAHARRAASLKYHATPTCGIKLLALYTRATFLSHASAGSMSVQRSRRR